MAIWGGGALGMAQKRARECVVKLYIQEAAVPASGKMEVTENDDFCIFSATEKPKWKTSICFL